MPLLTFDIVDQCNLRCAACLQSVKPGTGKRMDLKRCKRILDHATDKFGITDLAPFNWGEPMLRKDLPDFLRLFAAYEGLTVALSSNMTVSAPEDRIAEILAHTHNFRFSVSGWTQEVYQQYHRGGRIDRVKKHIERFLKVRDATGSSTQFDLLFGQHMHNETDAQALRTYCEANDIRFRPTRYFIASLKAVDRLLHGNPIPPEFYNLFHHSEEEAREEIRESLTPKVCPFLYEIVADVEGNLMTCCGDRISLTTPLTEVESVEELPKLRLQHPFCRRCFDLGLNGYFQPGPDKRAYSELPDLHTAIPLKNVRFAEWEKGVPAQWASNVASALSAAQETGGDGEPGLALAPPDSGYINFFQYVEIPAKMAGATLTLHSQGKAATPDTLCLKIHVEIHGAWSSQAGAPHSGSGAWKPLETTLSLPANFPGGRLKVEAIHYGSATLPCFLGNLTLTAARSKSV